MPSVFYQGKNWLIVDRLFHLLVRQLVFPNIPIFHLLVTLSKTSMFRFCTFATWPHRPPLSVSLIHVVTIPTSLCPSSVAEYNTMTLEGRKHTHTHKYTCPPPVHILYGCRVKICKASPSSKQKLQGNIGQLSKLKCIPRDMSFFFICLLSSPVVPTEENGLFCSLV